MSKESQYLLIKKELKDGKDIVNVLDGIYNKKRIPYTYNIEFEETDIDCLELSVRSYNCLKRAGIHTIGQLFESIDGIEDLLRFRNLGRKSAIEVMNRLLFYRYSTYSDEQKDKFVKRIVEENI